MPSLYLSPHHLPAFFFCPALPPVPFALLPHTHLFLPFMPSALPHCLPPPTVGSAPYYLPQTTTTAMPACALLTHTPVPVVLPLIFTVFCLPHHSHALFIYLPSPPPHHLPPALYLPVFISSTPDPSLLHTPCHHACHCACLIPGTTLPDQRRATGCPQAFYRRGQRDLLMAFREKEKAGSSSSICVCCDAIGK